MEKASVSSKTPTKSFMAISITVSSKVRENFTLRQETTTWESSGSTKSKEEAFTPGLARKVTFTRDNLREENETGKVLSGGPTAVGTRASSETEFKADGECSTGKEDTGSTRATGTTACSTEKAPSTSKTASAMKASSRRISSTEKASSTKMTPSFTGSGRTTNCQSSTWSNPHSETNDLQHT